MKNTRTLIITAVAVVLVGALALGGFILTRGSSDSQASGQERSVSSSVRGGRSNTTNPVVSDRTEGSNGSVSIEGVSDAASSVTDEPAPGSASTSGSASTGTSESSSASSGTAGSAEGAGSAGSGSSSSGGGSPVSPVGDRATWGPVTGVSPVIDFPMLDSGPSISSPTWSCGSKIIFSVTVTDPNGVVNVWGSYYVGGSKQSFTASNSSGNVWSTTIITGSGLPLNSLVVYAKDGAGNNANLAVGTVCL